MWKTKRVIKNLTVLQKTLISLIFGGISFFILKTVFTTRVSGSYPLYISSTTTEWIPTIIGILITSALTFFILDFISKSY